MLRRTSLLLLLAILACSRIAPASAAPLTSDAQAAVDTVFADYDHPGMPGYAIGIVQDGELTYAKGYGRANLDDDVPITPQTSFHLASLSKQFVAATVAQLILEGRLSLDTPVSQYFPALKRFAPGLQIRHLIYFTSGLPEYSSLPRRSGMPWFSAYYFTTDEAIAATLKAGRLKFQPGTRWDYSNIDYMLLAKIVERIRGQPMATILRERVFAPLGMLDSLLDDDSTEIIPHRATGYADRGNAAVVSKLKELGIQIDSGSGYLRLVRNAPHYGGSGVFSTVADLAKWQESFETDRLGADFTHLMLSRMRFAHDKDNDAFGLVHGEFRGHETIWFAGGDLDTSTYIVRIPDLRLGVICLSNRLDGDAQGRATAVLGQLVPETQTPAH